MRWAHSGELLPLTGAVLLGTGSPGTGAAALVAHAGMDLPACKGFC